MGRCPTEYLLVGLELDVLLAETFELVAFGLDKASGSRLRSAASRSDLTQFQRVPSAMLSDRATSAIGRPDDFTRSNASLRNWSGYLFGRPIMGSFLHGIPRNQVSKKPGQHHRLDVANSIEPPE